jgi:predicted cupin superfamily sugar epimerase
MIGLYCENPLSISCFHRLTYDEVWHAYSSDPFILVLLHPDGSSEEVLMGCDPLKGQKVQYVIPAHTWQAGYVAPGGRYALFGCTMVPGFNPSCFEAGIAEDLIEQYPGRKDDILRLSINGHETRIPEGFDK